MDGQLVTAGLLGQVMVATGTGSTIRAAQKSAYDLAQRLVVPNLRYRLDIGDKLATIDFDNLAQLGLFEADAFSHG
jgi:phosphoribosylamine--glycine ligase